jgi:hypothetical protein
VSQQTLFVIFLACVAFVAMFALPVYVAGKRRHRESNAIFTCTMLSVIFPPLWLVAMIWACTSNVRPRP